MATKGQKAGQLLPKQQQQTPSGRKHFIAVSHSLVLCDGAIGLAADGHQDVPPEQDAGTAAGAGANAVTALRQGGGPASPNHACALQR
jgi:hypothetical protein